MRSKLRTILLRLKNFARKRLGNKPSTRCIRPAGFFVPKNSPLDATINATLNRLLFGKQFGLDLPNLVKEFVDQLHEEVQAGSISGSLELFASKQEGNPEEREVLAALEIWIRQSLADWGWIEKRCGKLGKEAAVSISLRRLLMQNAKSKSEKIDYLSSTNKTLELNQADIDFLTLPELIERAPRLYLGAMRALAECHGLSTSYFEAQEWVHAPVTVFDAWSNSYRSSARNIKPEDAVRTSPAKIARLVGHPAGTPASSPTASTPAVVAVDDGLVFSGEWQALTSNGSLILDLYSGTPHHMASSYGSLSQAACHARLLYSSRTQSIDSAFLIGGDQNYFHWVHDVLPRAVWKATDGRFDETPALTCALSLSYQQEILAIAGLEVDDAIQAPYPQVLRVGRALIPLLAPQNRAFKPSYGEVRRWAHDQFGKSAVPSFSKDSWENKKGGNFVYVKRGPGERRKLINEDEIASAFLELGYKVVDPSTLDVASQVRVFNEAAVVVSPHGAALANICFCRPKTRVLELAFPTWAPEYFHLVANERDLLFDRCYLSPAPNLAVQQRFHDGYLLPQLVEVMHERVAGGNQQVAY